MTEENGNGNGNGILEAIVGSSDDAIFSKTLDGTVTTWNPAAERLYRYSAEEMIGQDVRILAPDPEGVREIDEILQGIARGEKIGRESTTRKTKDGRIVRVTISVSPVRDENGTIIGASVIAHEPTSSEREIAEMRAIVASASAQAQEMRGMVSAAIAQAAQTEIMGKRIHDLKNVYSAVAGALGRLEDSVGLLITGEDVDARLEIVENKVNKDLEERVKHQDKRLLRAIAGGVAVAIMFAGGFVRLESIHSCDQRNKFRNELAQVIETSFTSGPVDPALVPAELRPLIEESTRRQAVIKDQLLSRLDREREDCGLVPL